MPERRRTLLQLPRGAEALYLEEAIRHQVAVRSLADLFGSWGYLPVQTPILDFYDIYRPFLDPGAVEHVYRLVDREGDLLMLRSDITLFLAKQVAKLASHEDLPIRLWYADTILRHQDIEDISKNEFFQAGIELIGKTGDRADLEALTLLVEAMDLVGVGGYRVHLGSRRLFDLATAGLDDVGRQAAASALTHRDRSGLESALSTANAPRAAEIADLFLTILSGSEAAAIIDGVGRAFPTGEGPAHEEAAYLLHLVDQLGRVGILDRFRIDLSEIGGQTYYTGIVFQVYAPGFGSALASGGRYDRLLSCFGCEAPSVGYSMMLSKLRASDTVPLEAGPAWEAEGTDFADSLTQARMIRESGRAAIIA